MLACSPGANEARRLPTSILPSMPSDGTHVVPSASMHSPLVHAAAKLLQSSLVVQASQACVPIRVWIWLATCDCKMLTTMPLATALVMVHRMPPDSVIAASWMVMAVLEAERPVVLLVLSTVNARSDVAFIVCGLPLVVSIVTSQAPRTGALIGSGWTVLTTTSVDRCRRLGAVGVRASDLKSKLSVHTWFGMAQQISVDPPHEGGTVNVLPPMSPGMSVAPLVEM